MTTSSKTGRAIPKRDSQIAVDALRTQNIFVNTISEDRTFLRKSGKSYTESNHLIPISKYRDFNYRLNVMENIVSLCSHCHNLLHCGNFESKLPLQDKLYNARKTALHKCG